MRIKSLYQNWVKWVLPLYFFIFLPFSVSAEDGHQLWLRFQPVNKAKVTGPECIAAQELRTYSTQDVELRLDGAMEEEEFRIEPSASTGSWTSQAAKPSAGVVITAKDEIGLL